MPYLVRHAHAGDKRAWAGPDRLRPLSETGRREAHGPAVGEAVLCSHGELIGAVLERLVGRELDDEVELAWPKGSTWVLAVEDGHLRQHRYLPPLRLHDAEAGRWGRSP